MSSRFVRTVRSLRSLCYYGRGLPCYEFHVTNLDRSLYQVPEALHQRHVLRKQLVREQPRTISYLRLRVRPRIPRRLVRRTW